MASVILQCVVTFFICCSCVWFKKQETESYWICINLHFLKFKWKNVMWIKTLYRYKLVELKCAHNKFLTKYTPTNNTQFRTHIARGLHQRNYAGKKKTKLYAYFRKVFLKALLWSHAVGKVAIWMILTTKNLRGTLLGTLKLQRKDTTGNWRDLNVNLQSWNLPTLSWMKRKMRQVMVKACTQNSGGVVSF